jgi:hypothetical protein
LWAVTVNNAEVWVKPQAATILGVVTSCSEGDTCEEQKDAFRTYHKILEDQAHSKRVKDSGLVLPR